MKIYPNYTGLIFSVTKNGKTSYYKIKGEVRSGSTVFGETGSYPVVKCTKNGKEFRSTNGYSVDVILKMITRFNLGIQDPSDTYKVVFMWSTVGDKANIEDGIKSTNKKKKIQYLKDKIKCLNEELESLENNS